MLKIHNPTLYLITTQQNPLKIRRVSIFLPYHAAARFNRVAITTNALSFLRYHAIKSLLLPHESSRVAFAKAKTLPN
jgi:hypothetical protein